MNYYEEKQKLREEKEKNMIKYIKRGAITLGTGILLTTAWVSFTETVTQGHMGVVFDKSRGGVQKEPLDQGLHFVSPLAKVTEYPVSTETVNYKFSLLTADNQTVTLPISYDYQNDPSKITAIYDEFRGQKPEDLEKGRLMSIMSGIASDVVSKYNTLDLNASRDEIQAKILSAYKKALEPKGFHITRVQVGKPSFNAETDKAIQAVITKQQELKGLELEKQKTELEAQRKEIEAKGNAQKALIEAEGQAKANRAVQDSITPQLLQKMEMEARIKHGWVTTQAGQAIVDAEKK